MSNRRVQVSPRTQSRIRLLRWIAVAVLLMAAGFQWVILPRITEAKLQTLAGQLSAQYGLVVRFKDPVDFFVPPLAPVDQAAHIHITPAQQRHVAVALEGVTRALKKYPASLIQQYLKAVFVARTLEIDGVSGAAMFANQWIYVATPPRDGSGADSFELSLHHELSSLFFYDGNFPTLRWHLVNDADFRYLEKQDDIIQAAAPENRKEIQEQATWHEAGFVSDYGMASMENDVNTYAELAMGAPEKLRQLCGQYPKIAQKKKILINYYTKLAPELGAYFQKEQLAAKKTEAFINVAAQEAPQDQR